jgi:hypothetical protein
MLKEHIKHLQQVFYSNCCTLSTTITTYCEVKVILARLVAYDFVTSKVNCSYHIM